MRDLARGGLFCSARRARRALAGSKAQREVFRRGCTLFPNERFSFDAGTSRRGPKGPMGGSSAEARRAPAALPPRSRRAPAAWRWRKTRPRFACSSAARPPRRPGLSPRRARHQSRPKAPRGGPASIFFEEPPFGALAARGARGASAARNAAWPTAHAATFSAAVSSEKRPWSASLAASSAGGARAARGARRASAARNASWPTTHAATYPAAASSEKKPPFSVSTPEGLGSPRGSQAASRSKAASVLTNPMASASVDTQGGYASQGEAARSAQAPLSPRRPARSQARRAPKSPLQRVGLFGGNAPRRPKGPESYR